MNLMGGQLLSQAIPSSDSGVLLHLANKVLTQCTDWPSEYAYPAMPLLLLWCWKFRGNSFTKVQSRPFPKASSCFSPSPQGASTNPA